MARDIADFYDAGDPISKGSFGNVWKVHRKIDGLVKLMLIGKLSLTAENLSKTDLRVQGIKN